MKSEANYIVPSRTRQSDIGKISASLVIYISVGYSEFFLFLQPASTYSCQILLDTPSLIFRAYIVYFIDYVIQSMYRRRSSCYIMYTIYTLNVSITNRATSAPIRKIYSLLSEKKTMTLMSTLLPLLQAVLKCRYQDSVEMKAENVSRRERLAQDSDTLLFAIVASIYTWGVIFVLNS
jgi:hypothetical protein